jgi:hypothetical protein
MSATQTSICTNALLMLGAQTLSSTNDGTDRSTIAANLYPTARDAVLRSHPWNCATKRVVLAPDSAAPAFGYAAQFTLPSDFLRVVEVGDFNEDVDWKVEGGKILASGTALKLRYIWRNTVESTWDAMLVHAMELKMAELMAYPITMSAAKEQVAHEKFERFMKQCRAVDGQDDPAQQLGDERLLTARFGSFITAPGR